MLAPGEEVCRVVGPGLLQAGGVGGLGSEACGKVRMLWAAGNGACK